MPASAFADIALVLTAGLLGGTLVSRRAREEPEGEIPSAGGNTTFLFRGTHLIDATPGACLLAGEHPETITPERLGHLFANRFRGAEGLLASGQSGQVTGRRPDEHLQVSVLNDTTRVDIVTGQRDGEGSDLAVLRHEIDAFRSACTHGAVPMWQADGQGHIFWANAAYLDLVRLATGVTDLVWPLPHLFGDPANIAPADDLRVRLGGARPGWYRLHLAQDRDNTVFTAWPEDAVIEAQENLSAFKISLSNTFAHLSVGLAVFDPGLRLMLFNPALTDLTGIEARHLLGNPSLDEVLDRLRDGRLLPEPKDYHDWKAAFHQLVGASGKELVETWQVGDGRTLRVTTQAHEDGALALLIEDITSEIGLTRSFRAELELSHAVLDTLDDAIAVFGPSGLMTSFNQAFADLWGPPELGSVSVDYTLRQACRLWSAACVPTPVWGDPDDFALRIAERAGDAFDIVKRDGTKLRCSFRPIHGGSLVVRFQPLADALQTSLDQRHRLTA